MRQASFTRIIPTLLLAVGLVATVVVASRVSAGERRELESARSVAAHLVASQANDVVNQLAEEANRIETLAQTIAVARGTSTIEEHVQAAAAFDRESVLRAIFSRQGTEVIAIASVDSVASRDIPLVPVGLTSIDSGIWSNTLAYGVDVEPTAGAEIVVLIDRDLLTESLSDFEADGVSSVSLVGLAGDQTEPLDTSAMQPYPAGVVRAGDAGPAYLVSDTTFLGAPIQVEVAVAEEDLWLPASDTTKLVPIIGALLTLVVAAAAAAVVRTLNRAAIEREKAAVARDAAAARFRASFTHAPIGVVELSSGGLIVAANPRFASQLGFAPDELEGTDVLDLVDGEDRPPAAARLEALLGGGVDSDQAERRYRSRNGGAVWVRESISVLVAEDGSRHVLVQAEDISDERRARAELHRKALFDDLTGLPNRANLIARLNRAIDGERAPGEMLAVMFVDLDKFKQVNDTLGHEAGDLLLIEVAQRLRHACRASDTVARLGGDEFVVVCEGLPDDEVAQQTAERFAESLRPPMFIDDVEVPVSASIGLVVNSDGLNPEDILRQADQAMYRAKSSGRNQLVRFDIDDTSHAGTDPDAVLPVTADELRTAIRKRQLRLHYQPVMRSDDQTIVGLEALVRWQHPTYGLLTPPSFLPMAETLGMVEKIDEWVLKQGLEALGRWTEESEAAAEWYLTFNLAPTNYNRREFVDLLRSQLSEAGVEPGRVVLERNETWFMTQTPTAVLTTRELRAMGVRISLDHFGTGSSSINEVSTMEFDVLKIDRSFVRDASSQTSYVLEALKNMADALDLKAIVEGVETEAELKTVRKAGITFAQGFHLCRPLEEDALVMEYILGRIDEGGNGSVASGPSPDGSDQLSVASVSSHVNESVDSDEGIDRATSA